MSDNMCSYLKQILGGCPGIKNLSKRFCVWEESEDCSKGVDSIDTLMSNLGSCYIAVMATSQPSFEEEKVRMWEKFEDCSRGEAGIDAFISNLKSCYTAVVATSKSSKIIVEIGAFVFDIMYGYLERILGGCPGTKIREEFEDCSNFECCYTAVMAISISSKIIAEIRAFMFDKLCG